MFLVSHPKQEVGEGLETEVWLPENKGKGGQGVGDKVRLPGNKGRLCQVLPTYGMNVNLKNIQQNCYAFFIASIQNKIPASSLIWEK